MKPQMLFRPTTPKTHPLKKVDLNLRLRWSVRDDDGQKKAVLR